MEFRFAPLFSGSSGNALYVGAGDTRLLVDAGASCVRVFAQLERAGVELRSLSAILVTHEHSDHIAGVGALSRRLHLPVYATEGTWLEMRPRLGPLLPENIRVIAPGQDFYIGRVNVMPFEIPHDAAEPVGYSFSLNGMKCAVATDIGCIKDRWMDEVSGSDMLLLEANHDVDMLRLGAYPAYLKRRILGENGHLSNAACAGTVTSAVKRRAKTVVLAHLSRQNNTPELAYSEVAAALAKQNLICDLRVAPQGWGETLYIK